MLHVLIFSVLVAIQHLSNSSFVNIRRCDAWSDYRLKRNLNIMLRGRK